MTSAGICRNRCHVTTICSRSHGYYSAKYRIAIWLTNQPRDECKANIWYSPSLNGTALVTNKAVHCATGLAFAKLLMLTMIYWPKLFCCLFSGAVEEDKDSLVDLYFLKKLPLSIIMNQINPNALLSTIRIIMSSKQWLLILTIMTIMALLSSNLEEVL